VPPQPFGEDADPRMAAGVVRSKNQYPHGEAA
jgi:hypothetical protein